MSKHDLRDRFLFNNWANKKLLDAILKMPEPAEAVKLFSQLITWQNKWLERIRKTPGFETIIWSEHPYASKELHLRWEDSLFRWLQYLKSRTDKELNNAITYKNDEGESCSLSPAEIASQLNFKSTHHRAQIIYMMQHQGMEMLSTDYIYYALKKRRMVLAF